MSTIRARCPKTPIAVNARLTVAAHLARLRVLQELPREGHVALVERDTDQDRADRRRRSSFRRPVQHSTRRSLRAVRSTAAARSDENLHSGDAQSRRTRGRWPRHAMRSAAAVVVLGAVTDSGADQPPQRVAGQTDRSWRSAAPCRRAARRSSISAPRWFVVSPPDPRPRHERELSPACRALAPADRIRSVIHVMHFTAQNTSSHGHHAGLADADPTKPLRQELGTPATPHRPRTLNDEPAASLRRGPRGNVPARPTRWLARASLIARPQSASSQPRSAAATRRSSKRFRHATAGAVYRFRRLITATRTVRRFRTPSARSMTASAPPSRARPSTA